MPMKSRTSSPEYFSVIQSLSGAVMLTGSVPLPGIPNCATRAFQMPEELGRAATICAIVFLSKDTTTLADWQWANANVRAERLGNLGGYR